MSCAGHPEGRGLARGWARQLAAALLNAVDTIAAAAFGDSAG